MNLISRFLLLRRIQAENGILLYSASTRIKVSEGARIIIRNGVFKVGYQFSRSNPFSHIPETSIFLGKNSTLEILGDVNIGPGTSLVLNEGSSLRFCGSNVIAHNNVFFCHQKIEFYGGPRKLDQLLR